MYETKDLLQCNKSRKEIKSPMLGEVMKKIYHGETVITNQENLVLSQSKGGYSASERWRAENQERISKISSS